MNDQTHTDDYVRPADPGRPVGLPMERTVAEGYPRGLAAQDDYPETNGGRTGDPPTAAALSGEPETLSEVPATGPVPGAHSNHRRGRLTGLAPAVAIVPLVLVIVAIFLFAPDWLGLAGQGSQATPTAPATPSPERPAATSVPTPGVTPKASPDPIGFEGQLAQAQDLTNQSSFEEAIDIYQSLVREDPNDSRPEVGWARALLLDGLPDQALLHLRRALELAPGDAEVAALMAKASIGSGDIDTALQMAQLAVELDADSVVARTALAEALLTNGLFESALEQVMHALSLDEDNAEVHDIRAKLYMARDGNLAGAISQLEVATDLQPDMWLYHYNLGQLLVQAEDYVQGIEALTNALVLRKKPLTYTALGEAYYQSGQYDRAGQYLEQALSAGATDVSTLAQLADIRARLGYCEDARTYYEQALAMEPDQPLALAAKGSCEKSEPAPAPAPTSTSLEEPAPPPPLNGRIAFPVWNVQTGTYDVYVARPDGTQRTLAAEEMRQPAFSPKGQWLAVNGDKADFRNLCILRPDGSGLSEITEHLEDSLPAWSTDGTRLVFSSTRHKDRNSRLYVIDSLPPAGDRVQGRLLNSDLYELLGSGPAWLPDGRIVYSGCDYRQTPASCGLFAISSELGPQIPEQMTTHLTDKAPSVHGNRVAFMSDRDENWEIYVVQGDGSGLMRLTDNAANDALPAWSPDGQTIAFVSDEGGAWAVWAMSPDGSERRRLFDIGGGGLAADWEMERISWGP